MEEPCSEYLKQGYKIACDYDYNDDSRGNFSSVFCTVCGKERNFDLKEFEQEDDNG